MEYYIHALAFLERAQRQLQLYDGGDEEALFYAALQTRLGIEARFYECLKASLNETAESGVTQAKIGEYRINRLMRALAKANPRSFEPARIRFTSGEVSFELQYAPITPKLGEYHGKLGDMLHYKFFESHPGWHRQPGSGDSGNPRNLDDLRLLIGDAAAELDRATSGQLICAPQALLDLLKEAS